MLSFLFKSGRRSSGGRRLVDGRLVRDDVPRRRVRWPRAIVCLVATAALALTNPANQLQLEAALQKRSAGYPDSAATPNDDVRWMLETAQQAYTTSRWLWQTYSNSGPSSFFAMPSAQDDRRLYNFGLFSVRETTATSSSNNDRVLQVWALGQHQQCRLSHSTLCRLLQDALLPVAPLAKQSASSSSNWSDQMEQWLRSATAQSLTDLKYFTAYRCLLGLVLGGLLWRWVVVVEDDDNAPKSLAHHLSNALTRGFWPHPQRLLSSTLLALIDLRLYVVPALQVMQDLVDQQASKSWFRPFPSLWWWTNSNASSSSSSLPPSMMMSGDTAQALNYVWAVAVFLVAASAANLVLLAGSAVTLGGQNNNARAWGIGYSSDVWAAAALGYLRGVHDPDYGLPLLWFGTTISLTAAVWSRLAWHVAVHHRWSSIFAIVVLWVTADALGCFLGNYQATHTFLASLSHSLADGMQRFWEAFMGGSGRSGYAYGGGGY